MPSSDECPVWLSTGSQCFRRKSSHSQRLFLFERVFETADDVLNLTLYLVGIALRLQFGFNDRLADHLLACAWDSRAIVFVPAVHWICR